MILEEIAEKTKERVLAEKRKIALTEYIAMCNELEKNTRYPFYHALKKDGLSIICEVKKASPSKGIIAKDFPYLDIAKEYEKVGADAISVLTEPSYFMGSDVYLKEIAAAVSVPLLRKDFVVDEYMIYQGKVLGASGILLICSILTQTQLEEYFGIAKELGLSVLVETHDEEEIERALKLKAQIIGVNNRNLKDFTVDKNNSIRLRKMVPDDVVFVSESGIKTNQDVLELRHAHVDAILVGETLMRESNRKELIGMWKQL